MSKASMQDIKDIKNKIIQASLALASVTPWADVTMRKIAHAAGVGDTDLFVLFEDKESILAAFSTQIDRRLAGEMEGQLLAADSDRDRLFDVIMERFDILNENRDAVISILNSVTLDPKQTVLALPHLCKSMAGILDVANITTTGIMSGVKIAALTVVYIKTLRVWISDETADMAATMSSLDKSLSYFEKL